eukprot:TRINITY_DN937_c0_g1_i1.p1 TRINITY_DN937_c0_g1~~TRINITY_DN937_c0_g1_i1.p1  ORF type:complete len:103 (-),score=19.13 TRINITY_DN937_c0_g1_i1:347-655(-)
MSDPKGIFVPGRDGLFLDPKSLSTTPGGTIYGTTPGGTRIVYDRNALLLMRNSPLTRTPPQMPIIPGVTAPADAKVPEEETSSDSPPKNNAINDNDELFKME